MDDAAAGGGEGNAMKVARATAGTVGGAGEFSYTRNSSMQSQSINILKPILEQEIMGLDFFKDCRSGSQAIRVADFGCSVGANTLGFAEICYQSVCRALSNGRNSKLPDSEVHYFFCDLPANDFNTLFLQLEEWRKTQTSMEDFYATAVAGSFYGRLFPRGSLHVAICTLALNWISQVPDAVLDKSSPAYNKGRVWINNDKNVATLQAFTQTARQGLRNFLLSRADEVVPGGLVLIYCQGHANNWEGEFAGPYSKIINETWEELVIEGIIEEERRDTFNVPLYSYSVDDVKVVVESTNAFHVKQCEIKQQSYIPPNEAEQILANPEAYGRFVRNLARAVLDSMMVEHIGEEKSHVFFEHLERHAATIAREKRVFNLPMDCVLAVLIRK